MLALGGRGIWVEQEGWNGGGMLAKVARGSNTAKGCGGWVWDESTVVG